MKKLIIIICVVLVLAGVAMSWNQIVDAVNGIGEQVEPGMVELSRMGRTYDVNETVMTVNGEDVPWGEYWYWLSNNISSVEGYYAQYGMPADWDQYADYVVEYSDQTVQQLYGILGWCKERGITLSAEEKAEVAQSVDASIAGVLGEDATRAEFDKYLRKNHISEEAFYKVFEVSTLLDKGKAALYGANGENLSDEEIAAFFDDNSYIRANHILLMTMDPATYEPLTGEQLAEKQALAQEICDKLNAAVNNDELLALFAELKEQYDEDTGKVMYPDGYVFAPGEMVEEFDSAARALDVYELSGLVESGYGIHIIIRLPIERDTTVDYDSSTYAPVTAAQLAAETLYSKEISEYIANETVTYTAMHDVLDIKQFIKD